jgi:AraC family transcriptional regulator, 4-hydroxyphenylacetate 3-monooxygenase operon regulatory protein
MVAEAIPNIDIGRVYDRRYSDAEVHYESLGKLADFFGRNMPAHRHDQFLQVHVLVAGGVRVYLDDVLHVARAPLFFLTPPAVPHAFVLGPGSEGHVLTIQRRVISGLLAQDPLGALESRLAEPFCVELDDSRSPQVHDSKMLLSLIEAIGREFASAAMGRTSALLASTQMLLVMLSRYANETESRGRVRSENHTLFQCFNQLIDQHFRQHWTLDRYAAKLDITTFRLNEICRMIADMPAKQLVFGRQIQEAKRLLRFTNLTIGCASAQLGFKDVAYFCRFFQRHVNATPNEFRNREEGVA